MTKGTSGRDTPDPRPPADERPRSASPARGGPRSPPRSCSRFARLGRTRRERSRLRPRLLASHGGLAGSRVDGLRSRGRGGSASRGRPRSKPRSKSAAARVGNPFGADLLNEPPSSRSTCGARTETGRERTGALYLNARNRLLGRSGDLSGTLDRAVVEPRELLKRALLSNAARSRVPNHPSGSVPVPRRREFTRRLASAADPWDSVSWITVVVAGRLCLFREAGLLLVSRPLHRYRHRHLLSFPFP